MCVPRYSVARHAQRADHQPLRRTTLMHRQNALEPEDFANGRVKSFETGTSSAGLIALEQRTPLSCAHGRRTAECKEIDENVFGIELEKIEMGSRRSQETRVSDSKKCRVTVILGELCTSFPSRVAAKLTPPPLPVHREVSCSPLLSLAK
jgi:hypothetical protein